MITVTGNVLSPYAPPGAQADVDENDPAVKHYLDIGVLSEVTPAQTEAVVEHSSYAEKRVPELQDELRNRGLDDSGRKAELIARLEAHDAAPVPVEDHVAGQPLDDPGVALTEEALPADAGPTQAEVDAAAATD